ncbi:MAG: aminotransferase class V-fold PLP-dependent enzyme [Chloroflexi bacterium]|nr:aminotransferase class V-fold PLP-dependent enzyme [Chloroflexota bacterium]
MRYNPGSLFNHAGDPYPMPFRDDFLIRDDIVFLNHGSFGACPKPVFAEYQAWQLELERQPVEFLLRRRKELIPNARKQIAEYLAVSDDEVVFVTNATYGLSAALRSMPLAAGDQILTTNHEYGAVDRLMETVATRTGADIVRHQIRLPYESDEAFIEEFFTSATVKTKVILMSHITSPTALIFPVREICQRAREMGILTVIDGAHAPGQIPLDLAEVGADVYSGNFHKWLCAPKGSAFLHVRPELQETVDPLVISHGFSEGADFIERHEWLGTKDIAAYLSVPAAIAYQRQRNWQSVRLECHQLAADLQAQICDRYGLPRLSINQFAQMVTIPLPDCDVGAVKERLYEDYRIEVPVGRLEGWCAMRVSVQAYNTKEELQVLVKAFEEILS